MNKFTFKVADRLGVFDRLYGFIARMVNRHLLGRTTIDMSNLGDIYNALDAFWLKHRATDSYSTGQVRVIIGSIVESLRDNNLSAAEVRMITESIGYYWAEDKAEHKKPVDIIPALPLPVEETALRAVEVFDKLAPKDIPSFVSISAPVVSRALPTDRIVNTLGKFFR
jgi:hypothetical protein